MKTTTKSRRPLLYLAAATLLAITATTTVSALRQQTSPPPVTDEAQAAYALVEARPFLLEESYISYDSKQQQEVRSGWALVLRVPPHVAEMRNGLMQVLCVGDRVAERWNSGGPSGHIIVTVPAVLDAMDQPQLDLAQSPIWFAAAELPERVDAAWIERELVTAQLQGIQAFGSAEVQSALQRGGSALRARDHSDLGKQLSLWIEEHSPEELEYARSLRTDVTR
ncbi:MAG: hypothetical protein ACI9F9_002648 [Candidatus Paceibacteria bacterium]|jgi:hypothetical protein